METIYTASIKATARQAFIEYLEAHLKEPEFAEEHADITLSDLFHSSSNSDGEGTHYEIRGQYTASGNPVVYEFDASDFNWEMSE